MKPFTGTGVALITPFSTDYTVDYKSLEKIVDHVIRGGVEYIVALGTTSEAPVLDQSEKHKVVETILKAANGRVPVVKGVGGNHTGEVVRQLKSESFDGISGILSVTPYYNKPGQDGLMAHFDAIAQASKLPVILYNVPGRTSVNLKAETTLKLAHRHENIVAVKEASGDINQIMQIIAEKPKHFHVISGDDSITMPLIAVGAEGVISVAANAFTRAFSDMVRSTMQADIENAKMLQYRMLKLFTLLFAEGNPAGVKAMMSLMGLCQNVVRLPLTAVSTSLFAQIKEELTLFNQ